MTVFPTLTKTIEAIAKEAKWIPLWGSPPPFEWEILSLKLKERLGISDFSIKFGKADWEPTDKWREGLGTSYLTIPLETEPLQGQCFWTASAENMREISLLFLENTTHFTESARETPIALLEGFYRFAILEVLDALSEINNFPGLHFTIAEDETIPDEPLFAVEISISSKTKKTFGKILIPKTFLESFRHFFEHEGRSQLTSEVAATIEAPISIEIGKTTLTHTAWNQIHVGDFLLLDRCGYTPQSAKGLVHLSLEGRPLLSAHLENGKLTISDLSYEEEVVEMAKEPPKYDEPFEEEQEDGEDEELLSEEFGDEPTKEKDELLQEASFSEEETLPSLGNEIPLTLSVEVARIRMNLDKVMQLQPGNIMDLDVSLNHGVTLVTGGKAIARGELIQLGNTLGVKITELG